MYTFMTIASLGLKDWIEIVGIIVGIIVSSVAVYVSVQSNKISKATLLENNRMLEESTRPNLVIYPYIYNPGTMLYGLVIKNAGPTSCVVNEFKSDNKFFSDGVSGFENVSIEQTLINLKLGPNQSKVIHIDQFDLPESPVNFTFKYSSSTKQYYGSDTIDFNAGTAIPSITGTTKGKELQRIYEVLLEILKKGI